MNFFTFKMPDEMKYPFQKKEMEAKQIQIFYPSFWVSLYTL